jgi:predicted dehydrogenase
LIKIGILGLGEQALRTHLPCIQHAQERGAPIEVLAVVDSREVLATLDSDLRADLAEPALIEVPDTSPGSFGDSQAEQIIGQIHRLGVNAVLVASEPLSHMSYIRALEATQLTYHVDKPYVCEPRISIDPTASDRAISDLLWLANRRSSLGSINVSRRFDPLTRRVHSLLRSTTELTGDNVTNISAYYADGESRDAHGCLEQEQHPFKYGYGALNHSGYHGVDTAVWLCDLDTLPLAGMSIAVQCFSRSVADYLTKESANESFGQTPDIRDALRTEYDCIINVSIAAPLRSRTLISLSIVHDSVSNRRWQAARNIDEKLHLGRLSEELMTITQGESQRIFLRVGELPTALDGTPWPALPSRTFHADVVRTPLMATSTGWPVHEVLVDETIERRSLEQSNKLQAFMGFIDKARTGTRMEIQLSHHLLTQLIVVLAARSIAESGRVQTWPEGVSSP